MNRTLERLHAMTPQDVLDLLTVANLLVDFDHVQHGAEFLAHLNRTIARLNVPFPRFAHI